MTSIGRKSVGRAPEILSAKRFGVVGDGVANDTAAMLAFFSACIAGERPGFIPAGTYAIDEGELVFNCNFTDTAWPMIYTAGHEAVIFKARGTANAPLLTLTNGTATVAAGRYWRGGYIGGITFLDDTDDTAASRHGISLKGTWGLRFGWMRFQDLRADAVHLPEAVYSGDNPDPYATSFTYLEGIEAVRCVGNALHNLNFVGMDGWWVQSMHVVDSGGGWVGLGTGCTINLLSAGGIAGWAIDDGLASGSRTANRNTVLIADLDNVENGIRLNRSSYCEFRQIRFIHRFQTAPNTDAEYWPRTAVDLGGGSSPGVSEIDMQIVHRVEAGGVVGNLGTFLNGHSTGNVFDVTIDQNFSDQGSIGVTTANLFSNMTNTQSLLTYRTKKIWDTRSNPTVIGRGNSTDTIIPNSGLGTAVIGFPTEIDDLGSNYNAATSAFTAPYEGLFAFTVSIPLTVAAGTRVRIGLLINGGNTQCLSVQYAATNAVQSYQLTAHLSLDAGDVIQVTADQNTAGTVAVGPVLNDSEVLFVCRGI